MASVLCVVLELLGIDVGLMVVFSDLTVPVAGRRLVGGCGVICLIICCVGYAVVVCFDTVYW